MIVEREHYMLWTYERPLRNRGVAKASTRGPWGTFWTWCQRSPDGTSFIVSRSRGEFPDQAAAEANAKQTLGVP